MAQCLNRLTMNTWNKKATALKNNQYGKDGNFSDTDDNMSQCGRKSDRMLSDCNDERNLGKSYPTRWSP